MMTSVRGDKLSYPAFWRAKGSPITFLQSMFTVQTHWVKQCCYDTFSIWRAKVHWQEVRSSCGPHGAKDRHALWGRKGVVSGTAGQKYSVLLPLGNMLTTPNSLITAVASKLVAVGFFFLEGLECIDITEWRNGSELGFQILINAACHSNGND